MLLVAKMSGFTEAALEKKLSELNNSQQSIQTLSLWLIHHRKHHSTIVKIWYREFAKAKENRKLTFIYLANDVIQNSRKKGPEYGREFGHVLAHAFKHMGKAASDEKTQASLERLFTIWGERNIFDANLLSEFKKSFVGLHKKRPSGITSSKEPPSKVPRHISDVDILESSKENGKSREEPKTVETILRRERKKSESIANEVVQFDKEGKKEVHITLSPKMGPVREPPEAEELIKAMQELENAASSDGFVREKIAQLPAEVSDASLISKITDQTQAMLLGKQVDEALQLLTEYNGRLAKEMEDRKTLTKLLLDYTAAQKELLVQAEERLQEYKEKLAKVYQVREELHSHIQSLPDISQLPNVSAGLAPLPSAGDLFSLR